MNNYIKWTFFAKDINSPRITFLKLFSASELLENSVVLQIATWTVCHKSLKTKCLSSLWWQLNEYERENAIILQCFAYIISFHCNTILMRLVWLVVPTGWWRNKIWTHAILQIQAFQYHGTTYLSPFQNKTGKIYKNTDSYLVCITFTLWYQIRQWLLVTNNC